MHRLFAELKKLKEDYNDSREIAIRPGDANAEILSWLKSHPDWKKYQAIVFLDPFGMQLPWTRRPRPSIGCCGLSPRQSDNRRYEIQGHPKHHQDAY